VLCPIRFLNNQYFFWSVCREALGIASVVAAMIGLSILLLLGVLDWDDCLSEKSAWDTLAWFAVLVGMAGQLTNLGIVTWMSDCVAKSLQSFSLSWPAALGVLTSSSTTSLQVKQVMLELYTPHSLLCIWQQGFLVWWQLWL